MQVKSVVAAFGRMKHDLDSDSIVARVEDRGFQRTHRINPSTWFDTSTKLSAGKLTTSRSGQAGGLSV